jgi:hypothetical protein
MKLKIANSLILIAIGLLIGMLIFKKDKDITESSVERIRQTVDTVYIEREPEVVVITKKVPLPYKVVELVTIHDSVKAPLNATNFKKNYRDTLEVSPKFKLTYDLVTLGDLESISLGYVDERPSIVIREKTVIDKVPKGLYIGISSNLSTGLLYQANKNMVGLSIDLKNPNLREPSKYHISYYRKLF